MIYCTHFNWEPFFHATDSQKIWFPKVPFEIAVTQMVPNENILAGSLFLTVVSM
jgi:hypothetical protein